MVERGPRRGHGREIDLRVGGTWRYVMVTPDGFEVGFHGEYLEIVPDERIVSTEVYEGCRRTSRAVDEHRRLTEADGRTTLAVLVQHSSKAHRDAHHRIRDGGRHAGRAGPAGAGRGLARPCGVTVE